ncbi:MAG TPA: zinc-ribbon domain-containing protein [Afipia sp.]
MTDGDTASAIPGYRKQPATAGADAVKRFCVRYGFRFVNGRRDNLETRVHSGDSFMHIVCPHCTTSYAVDPAKFSEAGRRVRCARCQEVWLAVPQELASSTAMSRHEIDEARPQGDFGPEDETAADWRGDDAPHVKAHPFPPIGQSRRPHNRPLKPTRTGRPWPGRRQ